MGFHDRCYFLNSNPVVVARYFLYGIEVFFKEIFVHSPLGKIKYHRTICVESQVFGSPHVPCFLWMVIAPVLTSCNKEQYAAFVDQTVHTFVPERNENPDLHGLFKSYQLHRHLRTCRKYKNEACRFKCGKFFTKEALFALIETETLFRILSDS